VKYFFDNCISFKFAAMLRALDVDATALKDRFEPGIPDEEFLRQLKNSRFVYITFDHKQKTRESEARAIMESGCTSLWLGPFWGKKQFWQQAGWLVNRWDSIDKFANSVVEGTCAEINENGKARPFTRRATKT
jgi:hypothetical protein